MEHVGTICTHCSNGCKTTLGVRNDEIIRGNNRDHSGINGEFLCIKGRYGFDFVQQSRAAAIAAGSQERRSWKKSPGRKRSNWPRAEVQGNQGPGRQVRGHRLQPHHQRRELLSAEVRPAILGTDNIDHHRTGDLATLLDALSGKTDALATTDDLYNRKAFLVVGTDLSQQHPFLAFQIRANRRHHEAHIYTVTAGLCAKPSTAVKSLLRRLRPGTRRASNLCAMR